MPCVSEHLLPGKLTGFLCTLELSPGREEAEKHALPCLILREDYQEGVVQGDSDPLDLLVAALCGIHPKWVFFFYKSSVLI